MRGCCSSGTTPKHAIFTQCKNLKKHKIKGEAASSATPKLDTVASYPKRICLHIAIVHAHSKAASLAISLAHSPVAVVGCGSWGCFHHCVHCQCRRSSRGRCGWHRHCRQATHSTTSSSNVESSDVAVLTGCRKRCAHGRVHWRRGGKEGGIVNIAIAAPSGVKRSEAHF